jgi:hypothetical protein
MGLFYRWGCGVKSNYTKSLKWLEISANNGDPLGMYHLSEIYGGSFGIQEDQQKAFYWLLEAAKRGNSMALIRFQLDEELLRKLGVPISSQLKGKLDSLRKHLFECALEDGALLENITPVTKVADSNSLNSIKKQEEQGVLVPYTEEFPNSPEVFPTMQQFNISLEDNAAIKKDQFKGILDTKINLSNSNLLQEKKPLASSEEIDCEQEQQKLEAAAPEETDALQSSNLLIPNVDKISFLKYFLAWFVAWIAEWIKR